MLIRHAGGDYRRFLNVRGLPQANELPRFSTNIDVRNSKRGVLPISAFEYQHCFHKPADPPRAIRPGPGREIFWIAGTYDLKPGSLIERGCFYPKLVRSRDDLWNTSDWQTLFLDLHDVRRWLYPWHEPDFKLEGRLDGFFQFGRDRRVL